jgi:tetratricopeptide (TPR) repeat protein
MGDSPRNSQKDASGDAPPAIENWKGLNIKGGKNSIHDNQFAFSQQGIQSTVHIGQLVQNVQNFHLPHSPTPEPTAADKPFLPIREGWPTGPVLGREAELVAIHQHLADHQRLAIAGLPGLGKSALAAAYGRQYEADYGGGIGWFDGVNLAAQLAGWLQDNFPLNYDRDDRSQIAEGWRKWAEFCGPQRRALVIIDGVEPEHYQQRVAPYLPAEELESPLRFLVTTRSHLDWPEQVIAPLDATVVTDWLRQIANPDRLTADPGATRALVQRLAGWPLAIKIAIATLNRDRALTIAELVQGLDQILERPPQPAVCPQGLWAMLQISWQRLDPSSQQLARLCSLLGEGEIAWDWIAKTIAQDQPPPPAPPPRRRKRDRLWQWLTRQTPPPEPPAPKPVPAIPNPGISRNYLLAGCWLVNQSAEPQPEGGYYRMHGLLQQFVARDWPAADRDRWRLALARVASDWADQLPAQAPWEQVQPWRRQLPHLQAAIGHLRDLAGSDPKHPYARQAAALERASFRLNLGPIAERTINQARSQHTKARKTGNQADFGAALASYRRAIEQIREVLPPDSFQRAGYLRELALCLREMGDYRAGIEAAAEALAIVDHPTTNRQTVARYLNTLGLLQDQQGNYEAAEPLYRRSLAIREQVLGPDHPATAASLNNLAELYRSQGQYEAAEPLYRRALAIDEQILGPDHPATATSLHNLAGLYESQGQYEAAEPLYRRSLDIREQVLGPDHPDTATSLNNLAGLYYFQGQYEAVAPLLRRSLDIREQVLGPDHPATATSLHNLATLYRSQGQYEAAAPLFRRALAIREQVLGPDHPDTAASLNNLAGLYRSQGQYEAAEPLYRRALAIWEQVLGPDHPHTATNLNDLAALYYSQGQYEAAEPLFRRALAIWEQVLGPDHPDTATSLNNLAFLYQSQGQYEAAEPLYRRALEIKEQVLGPDHPATANSLHNLAGLYESQGQYEAAEPLFRRCIEICLEKLGQDHPNTQTVQANFRTFVQTVIAAGRTAELSDHPLTQSLLQELTRPPEP